MRPLTLSAALLIGCISAASAQTASVLDASAKQGLEQLRTATRSFRTLDSAVNAGYPREVANCLVHEHHGAMGYHHVNQRYLEPKLDVTRPQILLYEKMPDGAYKLNGVEFILPYRLWSRDSAAPKLLGQTLKREDNLNFWFLHVWAWTDNTDGVFADFNPAVQCPAETRKVFTPFTRPPAQ